MAIQDELPQSRITLKYRTTINGEEEDIALPLRTLILGDFSAGSSKDRQNELEVREARVFDGKNRVDDIIKDMGISLKLKVPNHINADDDDIEVTLPVTGMKSFGPDEVAQHVPQVKALLLLKTLLQETQSNIDNRRELKRIVQEIYANPENLQKALEELKSYEQYKLPKEWSSAVEDSNDNNHEGK